MILARYALTTGTISGLWEGTDQATLALQIVQGDPTYGYLFVEDETLTATQIQEDWQVVDGVLVPKP
jgi:hypothetical protein